MLYWRQTLSHVGPCMYTAAGHNMQAVIASDTIALNIMQTNQTHSLVFSCQKYWHYTDLYFLITGAHYTSVKSGACWFVTPHLQFTRDGSDHVAPIFRLHGEEIHSHFSACVHLVNDRHFKIRLKIELALSCTRIELPIHSSEFVSWRNSS